MFDVKALDTLVHEVKGMRKELSNLNNALATLIEGVHKINTNLEEIEKQNKDRFERRHRALEAELATPGSHRHHR